MRELHVLVHVLPTAADDAQKAYEKFVKDSNFSIEEKKKSIINKSDEKAKAEDEAARLTAKAEEVTAVLHKQQQLEETLRGKIAAAELVSREERVRADAAAKQRAEEEAAAKRRAEEEAAAERSYTQRQRELENESFENEASLQHLEIER